MQTQDLLPPLVAALEAQAHDLSPPTAAPYAQPMLLVKLTRMREMIVGLLDHIDERLGHLEVKIDAMFNEIQ